ncbi:IclR family transcriptional regulator [uncultured Amnibacterium sp.]|uniref:IclR family transcriptional regulator n=1 Tax=uncultured Amnibacterium sp. TaxID=1631851 RepID=UPI0035CBF0C1
MSDTDGSGTPMRVSAYRERNSTADRALDILGLFTSDRLKVSAIDVAAELAVARSTAYRYLLTLGSAGYLEEDPTGGFRLGLKVFELARLARSSYGLSQVALPTLRALAHETSETTLLTRRSGSRAVCLEREEPSDHRVRLSYERGSALTLNAGASAWVLLAWENPDTVRALLRETPLPRLTESTLTTEAQIVERLESIREQGYCVTRGELDPDTIGIAAPIWDDQHRVVAGLSVVAVKRRVPEERVDGLLAQVRAASATVSDLVALTSN